MVIIIAHRGGRSLGAENTNSTIQKSIIFGASHVEIDIRLTKDGIPILFHDEKVNRMTTGIGHISQMNYEDIEKLRLKRKGGKIPTLYDVLIEFKGKCQFVLDIKTRSTMMPAYKMVKKNKMLDDVIFTSRDGMALAQIKGKEKPGRLGFSCNDKKLEMVSIATRLGAEVLFPEFRLVNQKLLDDAKKHDLKVFVWTVNCPFKMKKMALMGVDGIITDNPERLAGVLIKM
ncbi:MAG: glycerophosphodiester phosphodiesterase [Thermoplasmata archaeon]|nr:glycerophosphodiester phosphodiesterase [Thermoplasmata archaeon]